MAGCLRMLSGAVERAAPLVLGSVRSTRASDATNFTAAAASAVLRNGFNFVVERTDIASTATPPLRVADPRGAAASADGSPEFAANTGELDEAWAISHTLSAFSPHDATTSIPKPTDRMDDAPAAARNTGRCLSGEGGSLPPVLVGSSRTTAYSLLATHHPLQAAGGGLLLGNRGFGGYGARKGSSTRFMRTWSACGFGVGGGGKALFSTVRSVVPLVKVGNSSKWDVFRHNELMGMVRTDLLKALKADDVFGFKLKDVDLSACSVFVVKGALPSGAEEPTAADESGDHVVELTGAKTIADVAGSGPFFLRVRLPAPAPIVPTAFSNVRTYPRESITLSAHDAALAVLADRSKRWSERLTALNAVVSAEVKARKPAALGVKGVSLPLFATQAHIEVVGALAHRAWKLQQGGYAGVIGTACRTLIGARGVGKTNTMMAFTHICGAAFPNVIALYVTAADLDETSSFQTLSLRKLANATARLHGVDVREDAPLGNLIAALEEADRRLFIIVDEVDELYRTSSNKSWASNVENSLYFLRNIGDQPSGRVGVLLCGSSASTYRLICKQPEFLMERYPLLKGTVPDLNNTKYKRLIITAARCNDSQQVLDMMDTQPLWPELTDPAYRRAVSRIITFAVGTTPRFVMEAVDALSSSDDTAKTLIELISQPINGTVDPRSADPEHKSAAVEDSTLLFGEVMRLLQGANTALLRRLRTADGDIDVDALVETVEQREKAHGAAEVVASDSSVAPAAPADLRPWEELVTPVSYAAVASAWAEVAKSRGRPYDEKYLRSVMDLLADASLLAVRLEPGTTTGETVWPATPAQLVLTQSSAITVKVVEGVVRKLQPLERAARDL